MRGSQVLDQRFRLLIDATPEPQVPVTPSGLNAPPNTNQGISTYQRPTYICTYTHTHTHTHTHIYIYTQKYIHIYKLILMYVHTYKFMHI